MAGTAWIHVNGTTYRLPDEVAAGGPNGPALSRVTHQIAILRTPTANQMRQTVQVVIDGAVVDLHIDPNRVVTSATWYVPGPGS